MGIYRRISRENNYFADAPLSRRPRLLRHINFALICVLHTQKHVVMLNAIECAKSRRNCIGNRRVRKAYLFRET